MQLSLVCRSFQGQLSAIWNHSISSKEFHQLKHAAFPKQVRAAGGWHLTALSRLPGEILSKFTHRICSLEPAAQ